MADSVRWMIEKLNHPELYQPWPLWLKREVARQNAERDAERAHHGHAAGTGALSMTNRTGYGLTCECGHLADDHVRLHGHPDGATECYGTDACECGMFLTLRAHHATPQAGEQAL